MSHTKKDKTKLLNRAKRIRGQIDGVIRLLENESDCVKILNTIVASRGAITALMAEVLEGHINEHIVIKETATEEQLTAADELVYILKRYIK